MSGAVGATCRHLRVDSAMERRETGGEGRYLKVSSRGWPECTRIVRVRPDDLPLCAGAGVVLVFEVDALPVAGSDEDDEPSEDVEGDMWRYVGFVSHENEL